MIKVFIATPCYGDVVYSGYMHSLFKTVSSFKPEEITFQIHTIGNESLITRARNECVAMFLLSDCTHLFFVDADIEFEPLNVQRLIMSKKDVACGCYPRKGLFVNNIKAIANDVHGMTDDEIRSKMLSFNLNINTSVDTVQRDIVDGFIEVDHAATGFMMIKRDVIEKMILNHPECKYKNDEKPHLSDLLYGIFDCMIDEQKNYLSEDFAFCKKWRDMGGQIWIDLTQPLKHNGTYKFDGCVRYAMNL